MVSLPDRNTGQLVFFRIHSCDFVGSSSAVKLESKLGMKIFDLTHELLHNLQELFRRHNFQPTEPPLKLPACFLGASSSNRANRDRG